MKQKSRELLETIAFKKALFLLSNLNLVIFAEASFKKENMIPEFELLDSLIPRRCHFKNYRYMKRFKEKNSQT